MDIVFILVAPEDPKNVGAAARAIKTMGHGQLYLVNPCDYLSSSARILAHGSNDILESAQVFSSLAEASQSIDFLVATTARHRRLKVRYHDCRELPEILSRKGDLVGSVGIVFGGETSGLCNADLHLCDLVSSIPTAAPYPSLNLAQAVMVYAFLFNPLAKGTTEDWRVDAKTPTLSEYKALKFETMGLIDSLDMPDSSALKRYLAGALARLGYDDLYLVQELRKRIALKIKAAFASKEGG